MIQLYKLHLYVLKINSWPRSEASRATVKFLGQFFSRGRYPTIYQQPEKGFFYFITLWIISQGDSISVDSSCSFCGFFRVSRYGIVHQPFIYPQLAFAKSFFPFPWPIKSLAWTFACFLVFSSIEIKSDGGYQIRRRISSDNHRPILYHLISFIQWEPAEIIRWVINIHRYMHTYICNSKSKNGELSLELE